MKYILSALAVLAAVVALVVLPPHRGPTATEPGQAGVPERRSGTPAERAQNDAPHTPAATPVPRRVVVYVAGEVRKPGVYALSSNGRGIDALERAGGALPDADLVAVNLAATLADGDEIAVPKMGAASSRRRVPRAAGSGRARGGHAHRPSRRRERQPSAQQSIDLNSADATELEAVPGIGPALAARIVAYRETNGPFASTDELADISGITPRLQDTLVQAVFVR